MPEAATAVECDAPILPAAEAAVRPQAAKAVHSFTTVAQFNQSAAPEQSAAAVPLSGSAQAGQPLAHGKEVAVPHMLPAAHSYASFALPAEKPFLGGFRNRHSGAVFHHAVTQTDPPAPRIPTQPRAPGVSTGAQTDKLRHSRAVQCAHDAATQCSRPGWTEDRGKECVFRLPPGEVPWSTCSVPCMV